MSDYLTLAEALAIHDDQIERLGYELLRDRRVPAGLFEMETGSYICVSTICLKSNKGAERGVRLLDRESIDTFMLAFQTEAVSHKK